MSTLTSLISAGGGGTQVNQIAQWYVGGQTLYTDPSGGEWLKTGNIISSGLESYPDAYRTGGYLGAMSYASISKSVTAQHPNPTNVTWGDSGTKIYVSGYNSTIAYQYNLSTPYDVSTATYFTSYDFSPYLVNHVWSVTFSNDGTYCYTPATGNNYYAYYWTLSTPWNISTASVTNSMYSTADAIADVRMVKFNSDGTKFYRRNESRIGQFSVSTPFKFIGVQYIGAINIPCNGNTFYIDPNGNYIIVSYNAVLKKYNLSTPFAITTATDSGESFSLATQENSIYQGGDFSADLAKYINVGDNNDTVYQYNVGEVIGLSVATGDYDYLKIK